MSRFARRIRPSVQFELDAASQAADRAEPALAFRHLERAHVLGQAATVEHVRVHWRMFVWATRYRKPGEAAVQLGRIVAAALLTGIGLLPKGNTGGANVSSLRRMPVPHDLQRAIDAAGRSTTALSRNFMPVVILTMVLTACAAPPRDLDLSLRHASAQGRYVVQMEPPATAPAINQIHTWQVRVSSPDGAPVRNARIAVDGGMPQHGHGLPTRPQVTRELAEGTYLMEGMKFSMTGWWEIKLAIQAAEGADTAVFNAVIEPPAVKR